MAYQLLRKLASDFTPNAGSNISFDVDHLKCDDYIVSAASVPRQFNSVALMSDGRLMTIAHKSNFYNWLRVFSVDLSTITNHQLSDNDNYQKMGMCLDGSDNVYVTTWVSPGHLKKYSNTGTLIWDYIADDTSYGKYHYTGGCYYYDNRIFSSNYYGYWLYINDLDGNLLHEINVYSESGNLISKPRAVFVDSTGIYVVGEYGRIAKWNVTTYAFIENIGNPLPFMLRTAQEVAIRKLSSGNWIVSDGGVANTYGSCGYYLLDSNFEAIRKLTFNTYDTVNDAKKGGLRGTSMSYTSPAVDETNKFLYLASAGAGGGESSKLIKLNTKDSSERYSTYQHDFGSSINIKRLNLNALYDNRDESWKSMRLWYQLDSGGYNEVDLKNPELDINGQVLDLKLGMTSYGFLRNWPEFYSLDILYDDNVPPENYPKKLDVRAI